MSLLCLGYTSPEEQIQQTKLFVCVLATSYVLTSFIYSCTLTSHRLVAAGLILKCFCSALLHVCCRCPELKLVCYLIHCFHILQSSSAPLLCLLHPTPVPRVTAVTSSASIPSLGWEIQKGWGRGRGLLFLGLIGTGCYFGALRGEAGPSFTFILGFSACMLTHSP